MHEIPVLETPRLLLRGHRATDLSAACALWQSPEVYRFITGEPLSEQEVWLRLLRYSGLWDFLGYGYWAVEERASGAYVGQLGFADFKRGLLGFDGRYPEAGWAIDAGFAGRGYATEGMQAACRWLDSAGEHGRSFCIIGRNNAASVRVAQKLGFSYALETALGEEAVGLYLREMRERA